MLNNLNFTKKIFVATPSDIKQERICVSNIVNEVNYIVGDMFRVKYEVIRWEEDTTPEMGRPQEIVNRQLQIANCDLFIGIIGNRFGTSTGGKRKDNSLYESGTQEEFELAYSHCKDNDKPKVLFFRSIKNVSTKNIDVEQFVKVDNFFKEFSYDKSHPGLVKEYRSIKEFEKTLRIALIQYAMSIYFDLMKEYDTNNMVLPSGLKQKGFKNIYIPEINDSRNIDKIKSIKNSKAIYLIAHSGYSFVAQFGHRFRDIIEENLQMGNEFKAVLTNPWSESGFFISLGEAASDNMERYFKKIDSKDKTYLNPIKIIESAKWYQVKFMDSINGFNILREKYGAKIQIKFTRFEIPSSILLTDNECFIEPYLPVNLSERHEKGMLTFEVKVSRSSNLYRHNKKYFNFIWEISDNIETYKKNEEYYREQLNNKLNFSLEG